jgi:hypothetical protein
MLCALSQTDFQGICKACVVGSAHGALGGNITMIPAIKTRFRVAH